jgi:catechol 2,3-dioxygenase-like lactoylglutathione lyase family enzyme
MIDHLDHIVLTTARTGECIDFYTRVLGMKLERFGEGRMALKFGGQKINLHERGKEFEPKAMVALPGTLDI